LSYRKGTNRPGTHKIFSRDEKPVTGG